MPVSDYFAELFVAGRFADMGWNVYFPHRDHGFDFIASKTVESSCLVRPVQVKGKYPEVGTTGRKLYGYSGSLTQVHPDMVLVIPYFSVTSEQPVCIAYIPFARIKKKPDGKYRSAPAKLDSHGVPGPRQEDAQYFGLEGLRHLEGRG